MRFSPSRSLSSSQLSRRSIALAFAGLPLMAAIPLRAAGVPNIGSDLARARTKVSVYADLLDLAGQTRSMWRRYNGFVSLEHGPTGRETRINGLLPPRDATSELTAARAEISRGPAFPECDTAIDAVIRAHGEMAPLVAEAAAYFEQATHREDGGEKARAYHVRLRKVVPAFLTAAAEARDKLEPIREVVEIAELAAFERRGRDGRWQIRHATVEARKVMAFFPRAGGVIDVARLDAALDAYETVVTGIEAFDKANPAAMIAFGRSPRGYLAAMRQARERIVAFRAEPKRWAPEIADVDLPFQGLLKMADAMLLNLA